METLDENGQLRRWDLDSQREDEARRRELAGGSSASVRVLSSDGRLAALAEGDKVRVFDTSTGNEKLSIHSANTVGRRLVFSRDGDRLVILDDQIRWLSAKSGEVIASNEQNYYPVARTTGSVALSADGLTLAVVGHGQIGHLVSVFRQDATARRVTPLAQEFGLGGTLRTSALTGNGGRIAVGSVLAGDLLVFDTTTGRLIARHLSAHASPITAIAFSVDGSRLATADFEGTIKIWADAQKLDSTSTALLAMKGHLGAINSVAFSIDGKRLITAGADKTARVWDLDHAGAAIRPLESLLKAGSCVARFSPDGQLIATADYSGNSVRLWDAATGRVVRELLAGDKGLVHSVAFSPTDNRLLAVGYGGKAYVSHVALWDIDAGKELARLAGATDLPNFSVNEFAGPVGALAFSPDGKYLVAGFGSKSRYDPTATPFPLKVWEVATRRLIRRLDGHTGFCVSLDFSRDGTLLASGSRDGTAILWSTATWNRAHTFQNPDKSSLNLTAQSGIFEAVAFSPDGKSLAAASREGTVQLWDLATGKPESLKGHSGAVTAVVFSPDGRTLASGSSDQTVRLWNAEKRRELLQLDHRSIELGQVQSLAFSPDGKQLLAGGRGSTAFWSSAQAVWDDPDRAALQLRLLLDSNAGFQSRIRMFSENLRLHEALGKLSEKDVRVKAALAAAQANWHASRQAWPEAVAAFDRLVAADPSGSDAWLRTPGLLRLAMALLQENRPGDAGTLLQNGASRLAEDPATARVTGFGLVPIVEDGAVRVGSLVTGSPASRSKLLSGDVILKVNGVEITKQSSPSIRGLVDQGGATEVRLTVRHPGAPQTEVVELVKASYFADQATGELFFRLLAALEKRLVEEPHNAGMLEMHAELAGQQADLARQEADYTAAITSLREQPAEAASARLRRLYRLRGDVYVSLRKWTDAARDFAHVLNPDTADALQLSNRARAYEGLKNWDSAAADWSRAATLDPNGAKLLAGFARRLAATGQISLAKAQFEKSRALFERSLEARPDNDLAVPELAQLLLDNDENDSTTRWTVLKPTEMKSKRGATLTKLDDDSVLAGGVNSPSDEYNVAFIIPEKMQIQSIRLEALTHDSLPEHGPGRGLRGQRPGLFELSSWDLTVKPPGRTGSPQRLSFRAAHADYSMEHAPLGLDGRWNISWEGGKNHISVWSLTEPITLEAGTELRSLMRFNPSSDWSDQNLGRFRLSTSSDPAPSDWGQKRLPAMNLADPWLKLAAAYAVSRRNDLASHWFGRALERARGFEDRKPIIDAAAQFDEVLSTLIKREPDDPQLQLADARKRAERGKQRLAENQPAQAQAELEKSRELFLRLVAQYPEPRWTVLTPTAMTASSGAKLEMQKDGSIFVHQQNTPKPETYVLVFQPELKGATGLRLEALADSRLPGGGPGWKVGGVEAGSFVLTEVTVEVASAERPDQPRSIALRSASADFSEKNLDVKRAIDGNGNTGWAVESPNKNHTAFFEFAEEAGARQGSRLLVRLQQEWPHAAGFNLGRFRLSLTSNALAVKATQIRLDLKDTEIADMHVALAKAHAKQGHIKDTLASFAAALGLAADRAAKTRIVAEAAALEGVLEKLAEQAGGDGLFETALARHFADSGKTPLAEAARTKARAFLETKLAVEPENTTWAEELAQVLFDKHENENPIRWTIVKPVVANSDLGTIFSVLPDNSILAGGANPEKGRYFVALSVPTDIDLAAVRMEALTHPSLPRNGPGRYPGRNGGRFTGTFGQESWTVTARSPNREEPITLGFDSAWADHQLQWPVSTNGLWNIAGRGEGQNCTAIWSISRPVYLAAGTTLAFEMQFAGAEKLGHFRLSLSDDSAALHRARRRIAAMELDDPWAKLAAAYDHLGDQTAVDSLLNRHPNAAVGFGDLCAADPDWERAIAVYSKGIAAETADAVLLSKRARAYEAIKNWKAAGDDWSRCAPENRDRAKLLADFARRLAASGQIALAKAQFEKSRALFERALAANVEDDVACAELAQLLLDQQENENDIRWTVLMPTEIKSERGATLSLQSDGSILASGKNPDRDVYSLIARPGLEQIAAIRLEAIPDPSLPHNGPGRFPGNGNFYLNEIRVFSGGAPVSLTNVIVEHDEFQASQTLIDGKIDEWAWANSGNAAATNTAIVSLDLQRSRDDELRIEMHSPTPPSQHTLGHFRLSASADPSTLDWERNRMVSKRIAEPWAKLAVAYRTIGDRQALDRLLKYRPAAASGIGDLFADHQDWEMAIAAYSQAITPDAEDADLFAKRAEAYEKVERWEQAIADWGKAHELVADKSQRYRNYPCLIRRAKLYERLRQFDKASADFNRAVDTPSMGLDRLIWRSEHWAGRGQWKQAADAYRQVWAKREKGWYAAWHFSRDRAVLNLLAGDTVGYHEAAAEMLASTEGIVDADPARWLVTVFVLAPDAITDANRDRLLAASDRVVDPYWRPRLKAALLFRTGKLQEAAEQFEQHYGGWSFEFLFAMAEHELGHSERARKLFDHGKGLIQERRDTARGSGVPPTSGWLDWAVSLRLEREAARTLAGQGITKLDARLKAEPGDAVALLNRARLFTTTGLHEDALEDLSHIAQPATSSADFLGLRGQALAGLNRGDEALADLNQAIASGSTDALVYAARGKIIGNRHETASARKDLEKSLEIEPSAQAAKLLADLLLDQDDNEKETRWQVLKPTSMKSEGGATLSFQPDGSIVASGKNPDRDAYTLVARPGLEHIIALRLEALPDPSLPSNGPGRCPFNGNFQLNEWRVFSAGQPCALAEILVTYNEVEESSKVIDGNIDDSLGWGNFPRSGKTNCAIVSTRLDRAPEAEFKMQMFFARVPGSRWHNLGRFRLSVTGDPAALVRERIRFAAMKLSDPWAELAAAYHFIGDDQALARVVKHHPASAAGIGDLFAANNDWKRAIAEYRKALSDRPADVGLVWKLANAYQSAGNRRGAAPFLAMASAADPRDTLLAVKVAALQAWFGQKEELASTTHRLLAFAKGTSDANTADRAAKICSILPSGTSADREAALALARAAVKLGNGGEWNLLALGMAEFRSGNDAAAVQALSAAAKAGPNNAYVTGTSAFYRAMSLFRQGKKDEARKLASEAAARMKQLPEDEKDQLAGDAYHDDLILWLAYKEATAMISDN